MRPLIEGSVNTEPPDYKDQRNEDAPNLINIMLINKKNKELNDYNHDLKDSPCENITSPNTDRRKMASAPQN